MRRVRIRDSALVVVDQQLGATWRVPAIEIDLQRLTQGGIEGSGEAQLALGDQHATLHLLASLAPGGGRTQLRASIDELHPAALARTAPGLAPLAALEAPVAITLGVELGPRLALRNALLEAKIGAGQAHLGGGLVPLEGATLSAEGNADQVTLQSLRIALRGHPGAPLSQIQASGQVLRADGKLRASLTLALDQVAFADLRVLWPEGAGGNARNWVTQNITAGTARDARIEARLESAEDFSGVVLTGATGTVAGDGLTVYWLRPVPPIERARATLRIVDPDTLEITAESGQQHPETAHGDPLTIRGGRIRITGLEHPDQVGAIEAQIDARPGLPQRDARLADDRHAGPVPRRQLPARRHHHRGGHRRGRQEHRVRAQAQSEGRLAAGQRVQPVGRAHLTLLAPRLLGAVGAGRPSVSSAPATASVFDVEGVRYRRPRAAPA